MSSSASSSTRTGSAGQRRPTLKRWIPVDLVLILAFAVAGRSSHERGISVGGVLETAWPFLVAYSVAVVALLALSPSSPIRAGSIRAGLALWLTTVTGGLLLRAVSGAGVALSFQLVTLIVLGVFLVLPRVLVFAAARRRAG